MLKPEGEITGDFNDDQIINRDDFIDLLNAIALYDMDGDNDLDNDDLIILMDIIGIDIVGKNVASYGNNLTTEFVLLQNYPNPFNHETIIKFALPETKHVILEIYDLKGQKIKTLQHGILSRGFFERKWNGKNDYGYPVGSGIYFYRIESGPISKKRKLIYIK